MIDDTMVREVLERHDKGGSYYFDLEAAVTDILALLEPETVSNAEELNALPAASVVLINGSDDGSLLMPFSVQDGKLYGPLNLTFNVVDALDTAYPMRVIARGPEEE